MRKQLLLLALLFLPFTLLAQPLELQTLLPRPKSAFERPGTFTLSRSTPLVLSPPANPAWLQGELRRRLGDTLATISMASYGGQPAVILGIIGEDPRFDRELMKGVPSGETMPPAEGYILDITSERIVVAGNDPEGLFHGVLTLLQLQTGSAPALAFRGAHINDWPDYPERLVFSQHNLRGTGSIATLRKIADTMAAYKLNGLQQNDFKYALLREQPRYYFDSVAVLIGILAARSISIIPGVASIGYSEGILWHDPNLAEGPESIASYLIQGDTGRIIPDPRVDLPNGNFESTSGGRFTGWSFYDEPTASIDHTVFHSGSTSALCTGFTGGNSRFNRRVDCQPYRSYRMSAWLRTESLDGDEVRLLAIGQDDNGGSRPLTTTSFSVPSTSSGWMKVEVIFNTLEYNHVQLYAGVWGANAGKIWWDDFSISDAGLLNVLRRAGAPLHVRSARTGGEYREGADFLPVADSVMLRSNGSYPIDHAPPTFRIRPGGAIHNGDTLRLSWFHAITTLPDARGVGQNMVCVSDEKLYDILDDQIMLVDSLYHPDGFMLGHDEIRVMNRDSACLARGIGPAALLADNVKRTVDIVDARSAEARIFIWSDMFDSLHNAVNDYYLINGDLRGVWNQIPRSPIIVNWNSGNMKKSMAFFAGLGFQQITSPYYDAGSTVGMRQWRHAMEGVAGMRGMMYTTWSSDYRFLRPFAHYAWGAGPYIIHTPLADSLVKSIADGDSIRIEATVLPDPFDPAERITSVTARVFTRGDLPLVEDVVLVADTGNRWVGYASRAIHVLSGFGYSVSARSSAGLDRETPQYSYFSGGSGVTGTEALPERMNLSVAPNPFGRSTVVRFMLADPAGWELRLYDLLGTLVGRIEGNGSGAQSIQLDEPNLPAGSYRLELRTPTGTESVAVNVVE